MKPFHFFLPFHDHVLKSVLSRVSRNPGCLSRIRIFSIPDSGSGSKNLSILTQKIVSKFSEIWSRLIIPDPDPDFLPIPDPGVKKAPGPGSVSATLVEMCWNWAWCGLSLFFFSCVQGWDLGTPFPIRRAAGLHPGVWADSSLVLTSRPRYRTQTGTIFECCLADSSRIPLGGFFTSLSPVGSGLPISLLTVFVQIVVVNFIKLFNERSAFNN